MTSSRAAAADAANGQSPATGARLDVRVANLDCESDAHRIESALGGLPGVVGLTIHPRAARVEVQYDPALASDEGLKEVLRDLGFAPQVGIDRPETPRPPPKWSRETRASHLRPALPSGLPQQRQPT